MDSDMDLDNLLQFCKETALKAGQLVLAGAEQLHVVSEKTHSADLVTEWDVKVENLIRQAVATNYPDYAFVGEESYDPQVGLRLDNLPTFVVDPIG
jgi:myo-inositol-1(or 4)-monophosphatase